MKIPLQKQIGQLADCKAATHKKQHSAIRRKPPHQDDPGRQRAEHFCLLFRQSRVKWPATAADAAPGRYTAAGGSFRAGRSSAPASGQKAPVHSMPHSRGCWPNSPCGKQDRTRNRLPEASRRPCSRQAEAALPLRQPASGRRAQSRRVSGRSAWTAPECHPGAAAAFPAVSGAAIAFFRFGLSCSAGKAEPHRGNWP